MSGSHPWLSTSDTGLKLGEEPLRKDCQYEREISYANHLGLMLQPNSFTDFQAYPDFVEAFRLWTQKTIEARFRAYGAWCSLGSSALETWGIIC